MANAHVLEATDANFETEVLKSRELALVDFWAEWCGPCKPLAATLDAIAPEFAGKARIFKLDAGSNPESAARYRVRGLPTMLFFKGGQLIDQLQGNQPRDAIVQVIQKHL